MANDRLEQLDYYTLLSVEQDASTADVKRAFRRFARKYHPDRFAGAPDEKRERANAIYRRGSEGVQVLCDPAARKLYDLALQRGILRLTASQRDAAAKHLEAGTARGQPAAAVGSPASAIRSPQARAFFDKAAMAIDDCDYKAAWRALGAAAEQEPGNALIEATLREVENVLRRL